MSDSFRASPSPRPRSVTAWVVVLLLALVGGASAQFDCLEFLPPPMFDTSSNPASRPENPRSRGGEVISWGGHQYLVHGIGNELELFNVDNPASPGPGFRSGFGVPPYGDRDYNLFNFSVCDDCRYGAAGYDVQGLVLFDFGSGTAPAWAGDQRWVDSGTIGAFTFKYNNQQYLIARVSSQCQGNALVTFNGINSANLGFVQCVSDAGGVPIPVDGGFWLDDTVAGDEVVGYVYLLDSSTRDVNMYSVRVQGGHPRLTAEGAVIKGVWILDHGFDIVENPPAPWAPFAVAAYNDGLKVWDLSDPTAPELIHTGTLPFMVAANSVEVEYPYLYVGTMHTVDTGSGHTYDISNPFQPQEFEPEFWYRGQDWNEYNYMSNKGGAFTPGGDYLFLTRYSVLEKFAVDCVQSAPAASYSVSPNGPFPGDTASVSITTPAGQYSESARWISDAQGTLVAGSATMSQSTPTTLQYTVPVNLVNSPYTVHLAVARPPEFPCTDPLNNPQLCAAGQIASGVLDVDAQPEAVLAITPVAVITGDTLTLDGRTTEGHPTSCSWEVMLNDSEPPVPGPSTCDPQNILAQYQIPADAPGEWKFRLTANYDHPAPILGLWSNTASEVRQISSVAAAFSVYPAAPLSTQDVILCSDSRAATANLGYFWQLAEDEEFNAPVTDASTCTSGIAECGLRCGWRINEAYFPDQSRTYYARLRLTNLDNPDQVSTFTDDFYVTDGSLNPSFTWVPTSPSVGQTVVFDISGVGSVDSTRWDFGRTGCSPYTQATTCTPSGFDNCLRQSFKYGQSGTNIQVQLWVTVGGIQHGPYSEYIDVGSGTCGGGTTCTYTISPTSAAYGDSGGTGTISVNASATNCAWSASTSATWIHVTAGSSGTGNGTVAYSVDAYTGTIRSGSIAVAGRTFAVSQTGSGTATVDFSISDLTPDIGEQVTFTVSSECQTPQRWVMGGSSCDDETEIDCTAFPSLCRQVAWRYKTAGTKTVNLYCSEGSSPPHSLTVQTTGSCGGSTCDKDGPPDASFDMAPNPALLGEAVTFTDTSSQGPKILADFSWAPVEPNIGQAVVFHISGASSITSAAWDFGAAGCGTYTQTTTCTPGAFSDCEDQTYKFASAGTHTVSVRINGGGPITHQVTVSTEGSCGGTTCTYSLNPTFASVGATAGSGTVAVTTQAGCTWTAQANSSWLHVTSGASYVDSGTVTYTWDANTGNQRNGGMTIASRSFTVTQAAGGGGTGGGYLPTEWQWTVRLGNQTVATSSQQAFSFTPNATGEYTVTLVASNCAGSDTASQTLVVYEEVVPEEFMVPAVVHAPGYNNTVWRSDLRIFNPGTEQITTSIEYRPREAPLVTYGVQAPIAANGTWVFDDITSAFNLPGDTHQGSLRITFEGGDGTTPVVVSRTYNDVAVGTYGQYVPAVPLIPPDERYLYLPGLVHNADYRTNLLLANLGPDPVGGIVVNILDGYGTVVGTYGAGIPGLSSNLLVGIVELAGVTEPLDLFTIEVDAGGAPVTASASLIDETTGDPVLFGPGALEDGEVCLPGVAHLPGALGSQWRSDLTLFNPTLQTISARFDYVPEVALPLSYYFVVDLPARQSYMIQDVLGFLVGDNANTKGYLRVRATEGPTTPMVVARTYNQAASGTFGQNLESYGPEDVLAAGETRYIPGVATGDPAGDGIGYRTNLGLTNASHTSTARVLVTIYGSLQGEVVGEIPYTLQAGQFVQFDPFSAVGLGSDYSAYGSIEVEVQEGGPVAAYASVVDNGTQDPILIPTLQAY